jgi:hypothetical protein
MLSMPRIVRPDPYRSRGREFGSPVGTATRRPLSDTKNWRNHLIGSIHSQASHWLRKNLPVNKRAMESHTDRISDG